MRKSTLVARTPHRTTWRTSTPPLGNPSRWGSVSSHEGLTPTSNSAHSNMSPLMPANGSRMAMRAGRSITNNYRQSLAIKPPGPGVEEHHRLLPPNLSPLNEMFERGQRRAAFRRGVDGLAHRQLPLRRAQLLVAHGHRASLGLPHGPKHQPQFTGSEVNIRADGSLDLPEDLLAQLDVVVASI